MEANAQVVIADDHPLFLKALAAILAAMPEVGQVHKAANGKQAMDLVQRHKPRLVILDLTMPELNGLQVTEQLHKQHPDIHILILSLRHDTDSVRQALQMGARGYLAKEAEIDEIELAVRTVLNGEPYLSNSLVKKLAWVQITGQDPATLTDRERQVLGLLSRQMTTAQIAEQLELSPRTIDRLRSSILTKTGTNTTAGALLYAERHGLLPSTV